MQLQKTIRQVLSEIVQPIVGYGLAIFALFLMYIYHIKRLVPGFSGIEKAALASSQNVNVILDNPLNAPHKVLQYIMAKLAHRGFFAMRGVSIVIAIMIVVFFFYTVRRWFSFRVAVISTLLFATCSWMLHTARLATPDIMSLGLMAAIAYGTWLPFNTKRPRLALLLGLALSIFLLYTPGMIWFVIIGVIWQRNTITTLVSRNKSLTTITTISMLSLVAPLLYALITDISLVPTYFGISSLTLTQLVEGAKNLALIPVHLIIAGPSDAARWLGKMPKLDLFASVMVILGAINFYQNDRKLDRFKILMGSLAMGSVLATLGKVVGLQIILPLLYLLVASGIAYFFEQWFKVFPNNPFAKMIATILILSALSAVAFYHINHYFVAWPQAPVTKQTFNLQP